MIRVWDLGVGDLDSDYESLSIIGRPGGRGFSTILVLSDTTICCGGSTGDLWYIDIITNDIQVVETHPSREITTLLLLSKLHNHAILSCEGHGKMVIWDGVTRREIMSIRIPISADEVVPNAAGYDKYRAVELDDGRVCVAGRDKLCIWKPVRPAGVLSLELSNISTRNITALYQPSSGVLLSGHWDGVVREWDIHIYKCMSSFV